MFSQAFVILEACVARGVHGRGCAWQGDAWQGDAWQGVCVWQGRYFAGETATAADGSQPTGMHSCFKMI